VGFPFEETFAGEIAAALAASSVDVLNAAAVSYAPSIYYRKVRHLVEDVGLDFDELVVFLDVSDVWDEARVYDVDEHDRVVASPDFPAIWLGDIPDAPPAKRLRSWLVAHSLIARLADTVATAIEAAGTAPRPCPGTDATPIAAVTNVQTASWTFDPAAFESWGKRGLARAQENMARLADLLRHHGRAMTVVVYPWPDQIMRRDRASLQVTAWRDWAAERHVRFVDLFPDLVDAGEPRAVVERYFIPCDVHFNAAGHRLIAEAFLREHPLMAPPAN
jgi:hypothetical protein